jgi:hypothetical protein
VNAARLVMPPVVVRFLYSGAAVHLGVFKVSGPSREISVVTAVTFRSATCGSACCQPEATSRASSDPQEADQEGVGGQSVTHTLGCQYHQKSGTWPSSKCTRMISE